MTEPVSSVTVVGAGVAGLRVCESLREGGFDGRIVLVGEEIEGPYDRPKLSKEILQQPREEVDLRLTSDEALAALDLELVLGVRAEALDAAGRRITLSNGVDLVGDRIVLACGAQARKLPGLPAGPRVSTLRSLEDAMALRKALTAGEHLVILGGGFVGAEVAASARALGAAVTVVDRDELPFERAVGTELARRLLQIHRERGVELLLGRPVESVSVGASGVEVVLGEGTIVGGDHLLVAVGDAPRLDWLAGSGLALADGVVVDALHRTSVPEILACGDVAAVKGAGRTRHWTAAGEQAEIVSRTILGDTAPVPASDRYFWSHFYDHQLEFAGDASAADSSALVEEKGGVVLEMRRGDTLVAVAALDAGRRFRRLRRTLRGAE